MAKLRRQFLAQASMSLLRAVFASRGHAEQATPIELMAVKTRAAIGYCVHMIHESTILGVK
jgi:hypothetical protein